MRTAVAILLVATLLAMAPLNQVVAKDNGMYNSSGGCGCHGYNVVTAQLSGVPNEYTASATYTLTVGMGTSPNTGGFNLEVNKGQLSNPDANSKVNANGRQATHDYSPGTTSWTFDWTAPSAGSGSARFDLAVLSGNGNGGTSGDTYGTTTLTSNEAVSNVAPTVSNLLIAPSAPSTSDDLTVTYTFSDDDGDAESGTTVAWFRDGAAQAGQTSLTLPSSATSKGESWHVEITPSDGEDTGTTVASSAVVVVNSAPSVLSVTPSSVAPDTSDDVTFSLQSEDLDGDAVASTESRWLLNGVRVESLDDAPTLPSFATRPGDVWTVEVRVSDGTDVSSWLASDSITVGSSNQAPAVSTVVLANGMAPKTGDDILATWSESDPDGDAIQSVELVWSKDGTAVEAANNLNPLPASFTAKGEAWTVEVRAYDGALWSAWASSSALTVANTAPLITDASLTSPSMTVVDDMTLNVTSTDVDGDDLSIVSVRWFLNDVEQGTAADQSTLPGTALTRDDVWHAVVRVSDGTDEVAFTTPGAIVLNAAPAVTIEWPTNTTALQDLAPTISTSDADGDDLTLVTTWYKNGFRDATLGNLTTVPADKLAPEQSWRLVVMADDGSAWSETVEATLSIANLGPQASIEVVTNEVWIGEATQVSGASSTDADGRIVMHRWNWDDQMATGEQVSMILTEPTDVTLTVTDEHGATSSSTTTLSPSAGPTVENLVASHDGSGKVLLTWSWPGEEVMHHVYRNGDMIGTTSDMDFTDRPPMSGANTYTVQPVTDERIFQQGADDVSVLVNDVVIETPAPAAGLGYGLGGAMVLALLVLQFVALRAGGGRT
ncbi:MAG: PKD domain-containing protein [Candidatus Poseidoniaceae archaeon]|nr:PKD domain-containing protein [Candidatus Poseidoniaceae archaeon]